MNSDKDKQYGKLKRSIGINVNTSRDFTFYGEEGAKCYRFLQEFVKNPEILFPGKVYVIETDDVELYQKTFLTLAMLLTSIKRIDYCKMISVNDIISNKYNIPSIGVREELGKNYVLGVMDIFDSSQEAIQYVTRIQNFFSTWLAEGRSLVLMTDKNPKLVIEGSHYYKWFQSVLKSNIIGGLK